MPNKRLPRAAKTLIRQISDKRKSAKIEPIDESADGLNVVRQFRLDKGTSTWLKPSLDAILELDPRIASYSTNNKGQIILTFTGSREADDDARFPLDEAAEVDSGDEGEGASGS